MSLTNIFRRRDLNIVRTNATPTVVLSLGAILAILAGYLVVTGNWMIGIAFVLAIPAFILLHKYPWLGVLIWVLITPLFTFTPDPRARQIYWLVHRALPPATLMIMLVASRLRMTRRSFPKLGWPEVAMAGYVLFGIVSIFSFSDNPRATLYLYYDRVISPVCLYLIIRLWAPAEEDLKRLAPVVLFLLVFQIFAGLLSWYSPSLLPKAWAPEEPGRTTGTLNSYGAYAAAMLFSGLFLLQFALSQKAGFARKLYLFSFILAGFGVFISFSRGAWTAGLLVILGMFLIDRKRLIQLSLIVIPLLFLLAKGPLASQLDWASERLYSERSEQSALVRLPVFQASVRMFAEKPLIGWGYENFNRYDWRFYSAVEGLTTPVKDLSSHNYFLTLLAEQGLTGTLLFLFPFIWWLMRSLRKAPYLPAEGFWSKRSLILAWLFIFAYMTINMFHNMRVVFGLSLWWVALALIANAVERPVESNSTESQRTSYPLYPG